MGEFDYKPRINVGVYSGRQPHEWFVFCEEANQVGAHKFTAGPFSKEDADKVMKHYDILFSIARNSVQRQMMDALGLSSYVQQCLRSAMGAIEFSEKQAEAFKNMLSKWSGAV